MKKSNEIKKKILIWIANCLIRRKIFACAENVYIFLAVIKKRFFEALQYYVRNIGRNFPSTQHISEAVPKRCSVKKVFLKFRKIYRKTPVPESLF